MRKPLFQTALVLRQSVIVYFQHKLEAEILRRLFAHFHSVEKYLKIIHRRAYARIYLKQNFICPASLSMAISLITTA